MKLYTLKLIMSFQQRLAHLPTSWLVNQAVSFPCHLVKKGLTLGINLQPCEKHPRVLLIMGTTQQYQKSYLIISKRFF